MLKFPVPKTTSSVSFILPQGVVGQHCEFKEQDKMVVWTLKQLPGNTEQVVLAQLALNEAVPNVKKEIGPIKYVSRHVSCCLID